MDIIDKFDKFNTCSSFTLSTDDINALTLLYQPLIGAEALGIYLSLNSLLERDNFKSKQLFHQNYLDMIGINLEHFLTNRLKLEAVGLITTYKNEDEYIYILKNPLTPKQFLADGVFGVYLYSKVGIELFNYLVDHFKIATIDKTKFENITVSFDDVFESVNMDIDILKSENYLIGKKPSKSAKVNAFEFDFEEFLSGIDETFLDMGITDIFKKQIINTAFVYGFDEGDLQSLYKQSINKLQRFDYKILKKKANVLYQYKTNTPAPSLNPRKSLNEVDSQVQLIENCTGTALLTMIIGENFPKEYLRTINDIYTQIDLPHGVLNCMIMMVLHEKGGELPTLAYFKKVADTFVENKILNTYDAIEYVTSNEKRLQNTKKYSRSSNRNYRGEKAAPEWVDGYIKILGEEVKSL